MSFIYFSLRGNLSDILYQTSAAIIISLIKKRILIVSIDNIDLEIQPILRYIKKCSKINCENKFNGNSITGYDISLFIPKVKKNLELVGAFKNINYFKDYKSILIEHYNLETEIDYSNSIYIYIDNSYSNNKEKYLGLINDNIHKDLHIVIDSNRYNDIKMELEELYKDVKIVENNDYKKLIVMTNCGKGGYYTGEELGWWGSFLNLNKSIEIKENPNKLKILLIIDSYGWAFDNICKNIKKHSTDYIFEVNLSSILYKSIINNNKINIDYDHVIFFFYGYYDIHVLNYFLDKKLKTINLCIYDYSLWTNNENKEEELIYNNNLNYFLNRVNNCLYGSSYILDILCEKKMFNKEKMFKCYDGVDIELFKYYGYDKSIYTKEILEIGWIGNSDDHSHGINKGFKLIKDLVESMPNKFKFVPQDSYTGVYIPHNKIPKYINNVDIIVCFSQAEGTPNQILEASSCGKCWISTKVGITEELYKTVENSPTGILINRDIDELQYALNYLYYNRTQLVEYGKNGRKAVESSWSWNHNANYFYKFIETIIDRNVNNKIGNVIVDNINDVLTDINNTKLSNKTGYSFLLRIKNEEDTIEKCVTDIVDLADEIIIVDNNSKDNTLSIILELEKKYKNIYVYRYNINIPRCGKEHIESNDKNNTLSNYYNWTASKATYNKKIKWDGDFYAIKDNLLELLDMYRDKNEMMGVWVSGLTVFIHNEEHYFKNQSYYDEYRLFCNLDKLIWSDNIYNSKNYCETSEHFIQKESCIKYNYSKPVFFEIKLTKKDEFIDSRSTLLQDGRDNVDNKILQDLKEGINIDVLVTKSDNIFIDYINYKSYNDIIDGKNFLTFRK